MGGACSTNGKDEKCIRNLSWENLKGGEIGIHGRII
jgi:hypothetical protein